MGGGGGGQISEGSGVRYENHAHLRTLIMACCYFYRSIGYCCFQSA